MYTEAQKPPISHNTPPPSIQNSECRSMFLCFISVQIFSQVVRVLWISPAGTMMICWSFNSSKGAQKEAVFSSQSTTLSASCAFNVRICEPVWTGNWSMKVQNSLIPRKTESYLLVKSHIHIKNLVHQGNRRFQWPHKDIRLLILKENIVSLQQTI